ncbi:cytochrome P450 [Artemisia annua]|uniref:Cytochrome P450 n=1 Tax=Artemisia annua TaxID=35608 RepID=A0A2U1MA44_ARTAN|nr:cytochrome P450 [Artemisia annua]
MNDLLGDGIFTIDGNKWREQRKVSSHEFSTKVLRDFSSKIFKKNAINIELKKEDILSRFVQINDNDPKYLRDIILNYVLAGKDPIAISLSCEEITNVEDFVALVNEAALDKMQYLHAALTETIRLYPALPADAKHCFSDDILPDGFSLKKGDMKDGSITMVDSIKQAPSNLQLQKTKTLQGTAGSRTCLGRDFAYRQMKILASIVLGCFMFKLSDEKNVPRYRMSINLHIDGQLQVNVFNRLALQNPQT